MTIARVAAALVVAYLPGALIFRLPLASRERRASLDAGERAFWAIVISVVLSLSVAFALTALGAYRLRTLVVIDGAVCVAAVLAARGRLRYGGTAARPSWTLIVPVALIALGVWRFYPSSQYVIGGKDPGVYVDTGVAIAKHGSLFIREPVVAQVPPADRDLFFPRYDTSEYYSLRFMGVFLRDPATGTSVPQLFHMFPISIAIAYGIAGLWGALGIVGVWATLGLLAVYYLAARIGGRAAGVASAVLLSLTTIDVWFGRYPSSEILMQPVILAGLLAFARAHLDEDDFFAPVAGLTVGLLPLIRLEGLLAVASVAGVVVLLAYRNGRRAIRLGFLLPLAAMLVAAAAYMLGPMRAYVAMPQIYLAHAWTSWAPAAAIGVAIIALALYFRRRLRGPLTAVVPPVVALTVAGLAVYAWAYRHPVGKLAAHDAYALRTFAEFYLEPAGLAAAILGFALLAWRGFWRAPAFLITLATFAIVFFYKVHVVTEHFWMTRRFLPLILPGALIAVSVAATWTWTHRPASSFLRGLGGLIGVVFLAMLGRDYATASAPLLPHVEYAGAVAFLDRFSHDFDAQDLVLVEARDAGSDLHVFAPPLAYIYDRQVLVLSSATPDKAMLRDFLADATHRYARVFFVGGGGTDLLTRTILADPVDSGVVHLPEYASPLDAYPREVRRKDFEYGVYRLRLATGPGEGGFDLDVGGRDDLNVVRFFGKETTEHRTVRWTGRQSYVTVPGLNGRERELTLVMHDGGRPAAAPPARVQVFFDDVAVGTIDVKTGFQAYTLPLPPDAVARAAARDDPARIRLVSTVWRPQDFLTNDTDNRELGVMLDRVEIH